MKLRSFVVRVGREGEGVVEESWGAYREVDVFVIKWRLATR
jgi:hypothetical protein